MNCPACNNILQQMKIKDVTLDVCNHGCGGVWFDDNEIKKNLTNHMNQKETYF